MSGNYTGDYSNNGGAMSVSGIVICAVGAYVACLCVMSFVMSIRARTRLRTAACVFIFIQLIVAAVGILWVASQRVDPQWFWLCTFIAEGVGMMMLCHTIVSVGNGFYPMTGKKNFFWRMAIAMIVIYALLAIANIAFYVQQKIVYHKISPADFKALTSTVLSSGVKAWRDYNCNIYAGYSNLTRDGAENWTYLPCAQNEVFSRPYLPLYVAHQMVMFLACVWTSFYLFIPLVRNHRNGPVGRPADSDTMAIGIWYLSCLVVLTLGAKFAFKPIVQAADLGLRATISPVFFLPAPPFLIRFYRQHVKQNGHGSNSLNGGSKYGGPCRRNGSYTTETNVHQGSFTTMEEPHVLSSPLYSPAGSHTGRFEETGRGGASLDSETNRPNDREVTDKNKNQRIDSIGSAYNPLRFFPSRDRGPSMESRKVFNQEFDQDDNTDGQHGPEDISRLNSFEYPNSDGSLSPRFNGPSIMEVQKPGAALTVSGLKDLERWSNSMRGDSSNANVEKLEMTNQISPPKANLESSPITGTTGWEVGGWGHVRQNSDGNENSLSSPMDPYLSNPTQLVQPLQANQNPEPDSEKPIELATVINIHDNEKNKIAPVPDSMIQGLTGLQKQLAEHRSALLPMVLAMQELDDCQGSVTYDSHDESSFGRDNADSNEPRKHRPRGVPNRRYDDTIITGARTTYSEQSLSQNSESTTAGKPNTEEKSIGNGASTMHWSNYPANKSLVSIHGTDDSYSAYYSASGSSKGTEKSAPGFKMKWLPGRKADEGDQVPSKKLGADPSSVTVNSVADESKVSKRSSINANINDGALVAKGGRPKEPRRGVFSKVLGGDRGRSSQDINDQERESKLLDSEGKLVTNAHGSTVPATVEALALESTIGLDAIDDEKGLQYYYPDPYSSFAEFKIPQSSARDQATTQDVGLSRNTSVSRHPLSTIYSDVESINDVEDVLTDMMVLGKVRSDDSQGNSSLKTPTKTSKGSKKSPKKDGMSLPSLDSSIADNFNNGSNITTSTSTSNSAPPSAGTSPQTSLPFGSLLSRSPSGSKRFAKSKGGRSKSDAILTRDSAEFPMQTEVTVDIMPIPVARNSSISNATTIRQPAQTSLSPPPRQSWARSKSFQGPTPTTAAALLSSKQSTGNFSIDTKLANELGVNAATGTPTSDIDPASAGVRTSLSSSIGSPTTASMSPHLSPTLEAMEHEENESSIVYTPSSPPLFPLPGLTSTGTSSLTRPGNHKPRIPTEYRTNSLDRDSDVYGLPGSTGLNSKTGFSTAAMDTRRANNRHQRSVDNLSSSYYYRRAAEFSGNNNIGQRKPTSGLNREQERENEYSSSSASQQRTMDYYGSRIATDVEEGSKRKDPSSQSTSGNGARTLHKSKSSLDYPFAGIAIPGVANDNSRTSSLTNSQRIMADDTWTKAMVARAQNGGSGTTSTAGGSNSTRSSSPPPPPSVATLYNALPQDTEALSLQNHERLRDASSSSSSKSKSPKLGPSSGSGTFTGVGNNGNVKNSKDKSNNDTNDSSNNIVNDDSKGRSNTRTTSPLSPELYTYPTINRNE
ncbi:hypothetical protein BGX20_010211 [Mortierella sp. AD010]|nr:hypothetical protein BGX20_010211 [Mortierella sp. AD010]